jgi:hypothetical protein
MGLGRCKFAGKGLEALLGRGGADSSLLELVGGGKGVVFDPAAMSAYGMWAMLSSDGERASLEGVEESSLAPCKERHTLQTITTILFT